MCGRQPHSGRQHLQAIRSLVGAAQLVVALTEE